MRNTFERVCWWLYLHSVGPHWFQMKCLEAAHPMIDRWAQAQTAEFWAEMWRRI